jgi:hypothetical protein
MMKSGEACVLAILLTRQPSLEMGSAWRLGEGGGDMGVAAIESDAVVCRVDTHRRPQIAMHLPLTIVTAILVSEGVVAVPVVVGIGLVATDVLPSDG